jgi:fatty-acyl-CoA synthase
METGDVAHPSFVCGAASPPLLDYTISEALDRAAARWPDGLALVSVQQSLRYTWSQFKHRTDQLAAGLVELGLEPGDRIAIWSPNCAEWALTQFAAARAGLVLVTVNPAYRVAELAFTLNHVGVKALVAADRFKTSDYARMVESLAPEVAEVAGGRLRSAAFPSLEVLITLGGARRGWVEFDQLGRGGASGAAVRLARQAEKFAPDQPINIQFTSGTTGLPKGATLTHRNILNNAFFVGRNIGLGPDDRLCIPVPLYHCFGMVMGNLACVVHGAAMVYPGPVFEPGAVLAAVEAERCTALYGVPTMFIALLGYPELDRFDVGSLRTGCMAGSPCPVEVMRQVIDRLGMSDVTIAYGMTETSPVSFQTAPDDPLERRVTTIGKVQPHLEVKIVDPMGRVTARGEPGEICVRGYAVMRGYWNEPERTAEVIDGEGWMHTGDIGVLDNEGYGNIVGRIKDMVIRGGENLYPREIEEFLHGHPKIAEVQVVGVPDERYGEELCAWIRLKSGISCDADEIHAFCAGRIAHHKIPRHIRFVEAFPMTVTGKVQKYAIREAMARELGLAAQKTA